MVRGLEMRGGRRFLRSPRVLTAVHAEPHEFRRLLNKKHQPVERAKRLIPRLLSSVRRYRAERDTPMQTLAKTLQSWRDKKAPMWRFAKTMALPRASIER